MSSTQNATWMFSALLTGLFAASASAFAKLGISQFTSNIGSNNPYFCQLTESLVQLLNTTLQPIISLPTNNLSCASVLAGLSGLLLLAANLAMWLSFSFTLARAPSSLHATALTTASNFLATAGVGSVLFGERVNFSWFLGALLIIAGIWTIIFKSKIKMD